MTTIHLDPAMVPVALRGAYAGRKFKAQVCTEVTIPMDAGLWGGGSRETYTFIEFATGRAVAAPGQTEAPWGARQERTLKLEPGYCVVMHSIFCGQDMGLTFFLHPDNATKMLPPSHELTAHELTVLYGTQSYKSSYAGRDRYQMTCERDYGKPAAMTRAEWDAAKASLITKGLLDKRGALTVAGKNAAPRNI